MNSGEADDTLRADFDMHDLSTWDTCVVAAMYQTLADTRLSMAEKSQSLTFKHVENMVENWANIRCGRPFQTLCELHLRLTEFRADMEQRGRFSLATSDAFHIVAELRNEILEVQDT